MKNLIKAVIVFAAVVTLAAGARAQQFSFDKGADFKSAVMELKAGTPAGFALPKTTAPKPDTTPRIYYMTRISLQGLPQIIEDYVDFDIQGLSCVDIVKDEAINLKEHEVIDSMSCNKYSGQGGLCEGGLEAGL